MNVCEKVTKKQENKMKRIVPMMILILTLAVTAFAQDNKVTSPPPSDLFEAQLIPRNSRVYIAPFKSEDTEKPVEGFETYVAAALRKKNVPLLMVTDRSTADFEIAGTADRKAAGWAKKIFAGDFRGSASASITVTNLKTGVVAYADASHRSSANKGLRSSAEKLAKYLKKKMEDDEKKMSKR